MTAPDPIRPPARRLGLPTLAAAVIAAAAAVLGAIRIDALDQRMAALTDEVTALRRTAQLIRLEGPSRGRGVGAIIEQIEYWAPQLATSATTQPAAVKIEAALDECLDAVGALGPDAFAPLAAALDPAAGRDDETRKWLLRAALRASPTEGQALLAGVLRGTRLDPSPRLRFFAADALLERDAGFAGDVLAQVLQVESAQGVTRQVPPHLAPDYERGIGTNTFPEFFNLIDRYVRSGHEDTETVLLMILGRSEHDRMTYQECIRSLGKLKSQRAVERIKELYDQPPGHELNPLFLNVCLQAIADIQGPAACPWFREQLRKVDLPVVSTKLQDLLKQHCG